MAWDKVDSGSLPDGRRYEIDRQVFYVHVPTTTARLPLRRKAYRFRLEQPDGSLIVVGHARTKDLLLRAVSI
ncbi:MAG: hypothetical protein KDA98_10095 [Acidimicrobiales bacterium]|nr:hypothetical protein [Acidimicrobiales bacterium]